MLNQTPGCDQFSTAGSSTFAITTRRRHVWKYIGSSQHLLMEYFARQAQIKLQHVPFRGGPQALTEVLGKRIDLVVDPPLILLDHIATGTIQPIAVSTAERSAWLPRTSTIAEAGFAGFDVRGWMGLVGPAGLPQDVVRLINRELVAILAQPSFADRAKELGTQTRSSAPEALRELIKADIERWTKVVDEANIERN